MGWGDCGTDSKGRPIGYNFEATCDEPGCDAKIDRGLSYACGGMHGEDNSCEGYFCEDHRHWHGYEEPDDRVCRRCLSDLDAAVAEEAETFSDEATKEQRQTDAYRFAVALSRVWHEAHPRVPAPGGEGWAMAEPVRISRIRLVITGVMAALTGVDESGRPQAAVFGFLVRVEPHDAA